MAGKFLSALSPLVRVMPEVKPPDREVSFKEKFLWTAVVLIVFLIMSNIPLYGTAKASGTDYFFWWRVLLASNRGTLMELGIGPIVTAGLIMQMLAGSKLIGVDFNDPEDRVLFTGAQKALAVILTVVQIVAYIGAGAYGALSLPNMILVFIQLFIAGIIILAVSFTGKSLKVLAAEETNAGFASIVLTMIFGFVVGLAVNTCIATVIIYLLMQLGAPILLTVSSAIIAGSLLTTINLAVK